MYMIYSSYTVVLCSVVCLLLFSVVYSPLTKRGDWSRSVSRNNCFLDHYLGCAGQLLANSFSLSPVTVQEVFAKVNPFAPGNFVEKHSFEGGLAVFWLLSCYIELKLTIKPF